MAWIIGGNSQYFNRSQMENNAIELWNYFGSYGWTENAVSAMLGNIEYESTFNPALIEIGGTGHGLVQWTPPSDLYNVLNVLYGSSSDWVNPVKQCMVLQAEYEQSTGLVNRGIEPQWYKRGQWQYTYAEWASSLDSPAELASAFCWEYLRPAAATAREAQRREAANNWYEFITGRPPIPPKPERKKGMPFWMMLKKYH